MESFIMMLSIIYHKVLTYLFYLRRYLVCDVAGFTVLNPNIVGIIMIYAMYVTTRIITRIEENQLTDLPAELFGLSHPTDPCINRTCSPSADHDHHTIDEEEVSTKHACTQTTSPDSRRMRKRRQKWRQHMANPTVVSGFTQKVPSIISTMKKEFEGRSWISCLLRFYSQGLKVSSLRPSKILTNLLVFPTGSHFLENLHGPQDGCNVCDYFRNHMVSQPTQKMYYLVALSHDSTFRDDCMSFVQIYDDLKNSHQTDESISSSAAT
jgi:hypothetical protein